MASAMPFPQPMLARSGPIPTRGDWSFEVKRDGFRAIRSLMKLAVCLSLFLVALVGVGEAQAARWPEYWPWLTTLSTRIANHPVDIFCESPVEWAGDPYSGGTGTIGAYTLHQGDVPLYTALSPYACGGIIRLIADPNEVTLQGAYPQEAVGLLITVRESIHEQGFFDEPQTECFALKGLPSVAASIGVNAASVQRLVMYARAFDSQLPAPYHGATC